jgi:phage gp36-like protein
MAYTTVAAVKVLLQIASEETTYDTEITDCIESAEAIIDSWLMKNGTSMPTPVPKNLEDATTYFAAWLFKRRRTYDQNTTSFWTEATRFFSAYVDAHEKVEPVAFEVCQD